MGKSDYRASALEHKYAEIPEENTSKRKRKKPSPKKAKHKHVYENCLVEYEDSLFPSDNSQENHYCFVSYCPVCGKINGSYVDDEFTDKMIPKRSLFTFGYISEIVNGEAGYFDKFVEEAKKRYRVFHQKESFDIFKQKFLEI